MWKLAWRNLRRNRVRTLITGSAIALSLALMLMSIGIADSMYQDMMRSAARTAGGDILVHAEGYWQSNDLTVQMHAPTAAAERLRRLPEVKAVIPRVRAAGLLSSARGNAGVQLLGIDKELEALLQSLDRFLVAGSFLQAEHRDPIVLGSGIVEDLGLELGDRVVLTATDAEGELTRALFRLSGVISTGSDLLDEAAAYTTLSTAQRALRMGQGIHQLGVVLEDDADGHVVAAAARSALTSDPQALEVLTWREAMPEMVGFIEMDARFGYLFDVILFVIVAFGIANTFLMMVLERIRELGLLAALGLTPRRTAQLILAETALLGIISIAIAQVLGFSAHLLLVKYGIDLAAFGGGGFDVSGVVLESTILRSHIVPMRWIGASLAVFLMVLLSSIYPAWRATRVDPVEAMRTYV